MALSVGAEIEIEIQDVAFGGRGVGRHEGCAVFVPGTLVGERVRVRLTKSKKRFAEAKLLEIISRSSHRVDPACSLTDRCPGCQYQHVAYEEEVNLKQRQLKSLLNRIAGIDDVELLPPVPSPISTGYRNKIVLHAQKERKLGYFGEDNRSVVDVPQCPLAAKPINVALAKLRSDIKQMKRFRGNVAVTFRWTKTDGVKHWVNRDSGSDRLTEVTPIGELCVPPRAFFQVNRLAGDLLLENVSRVIEKEQPEYLLDLYCGIGLFALAAAKCGVPNVLGVELQSSAIRAAKQNARDLGVTADFIAADVQGVVQEALDSVESDAAMVLVDPPRQGLSDGVVAALLEKQPASVVYVSCAPDTLARDLKTLTNEVYRIDSIQLIDMFPRTSHFESVTVLKR
jgi:23S rRNA (uracil1939-C5)-methyltransferase